MCLKSSSSTVPSSYALEGGAAGLVILKKKRLGWGECSLLPLRDHGEYPLSI